MGEAAARFVAERAQPRAGRRRPGRGARGGGGDPGGPAMTPLLLIRHGATAWNESGRIQGRADIGALGRGPRRRSRRWRLPAALAQARWLTSPLRRARETAALLTDRPVALEPRLIEMDWGAWEGRALAELRAAGACAMAANEALGLDFRPPGGESPREVARAAAALLAELAAEPDAGRRGLPQGRDPRGAGARDRLGHARQAAAAPGARPGAGAALPSGRPARASAPPLPLAGESERCAVLFWVQHLLGSGHLKRAATARPGDARRGPAGDARERRAAGALARRRRASSWSSCRRCAASDLAFSALVDATTGRSTTRFRGERRDAAAGAVRELAPAGRDHRDVPVRPARLPLRARCRCSRRPRAPGRGPGWSARCATSWCSKPAARALRLDASSWRSPTTTACWSTPTRG